MKKELAASLLLVATLGLSPAFADPIKIDLNAAGINAVTGSSNVTDAFYQLQVYAETTSRTLSDTGAPVVGNTFTDIGNLYVTQLLSPASNMALNFSMPASGINGWEMTGRWEDLAGTIAGMAVDTTSGRVTYNYDYTAGTLNLYAQQGTEVQSNRNAAFGTSVGSADDNVTKFTNGTDVATLQLINGTGSLTFDLATGNLLSGSTNLLWGFTDMLDGFWLSETDDDLADYLTMGWVFATNDTNTDDLARTYNPDTGELIIDSSHDGSVEVVVPEPSTFLLLGGGLLGMAAIGRRRMKK